MDMLNFVDIWFLDNTKLSALSYDWLSILSNEEQQRANRFYFNNDKHSFIIYHACKRLILSNYLKQNPKEIAIQTQEKGKPFLQNESIKFNLSHTKEMAVFAVSNDAEVGIDIEKIKSSANHLDIAKRFFHPDEYFRLLNIEDAFLQQQQFFVVWTAKEAILKATGEGIAAGLNNFSVQQSLSSLSELKHTYRKDITVMQLKAPDNYVAALALIGKSSYPIYHEFSTLME